MLSARLVPGTEWPSILDPEPEPQPSKRDWQFAVPIKTSSDSSIAILDTGMLGNGKTGAAEVCHGLGKKVICYVGVASRENRRDDKDDFLPGIPGNQYPGFPGARPLDIRDVNSDKSQTRQAPAKILSARVDRALAMNCDASRGDIPRFVSSGS